MPDVAARFEDGVRARETVQRTAILHVGAFPHLDAPEVPSQARHGADIATRADDDVPGQGRLRMHEGSRVNYGADTIDLIACHEVPLGRLSAVDVALRIHEPPAPHSASTPSTPSTSRPRTRSLAQDEHSAPLASRTLPPTPPLPATQLEL